MESKAEFFQTGPAKTYADATLEPRESPYTMDEIDISSNYTRTIRLPLPVVSAAMDTVTEHEMAIAIAEEGGIGVMHYSMDIEQQYKEVRKVKKAMNGRIEKPISFFSDLTVEQILQICDQKEYDFRTFPVTDRDKKFVGLLTGTHFLFPGNREKTVAEVMTPVERVVVATGPTDIKKAAAVMEERGITTLPVIGKTGNVNGLYLYSDVHRILHNSQGSNLDKKGQLRVAAAVPTDSTAIDRIDEIIKYTDVIVINSAQGDTVKYAYETLKAIKKKYPDLEVVVGNITHPNSARNLAKLGADAINVGQGSGAICTTRQQTGIGVPQLYAIWRCAEALKDTSVHVIADGGIQHFGDISKALAAGASSVMLGSLLAGTPQAPGATVTLPDGNKAKIYRGMGSGSAMRGSAAAMNRYKASGNAPLEEGVESYIPEKADVHIILNEIRQALTRSFMYCGVRSVAQHQAETNFMELSQGAVAESGAHIMSRSFRIV